MIRSEHSIVAYDFIKRRVVPDRLTRVTDASYLGAAQRCIDSYREGIGRIRQELHAEVEDCLSEIAGCPPRRIAAFCKLLDDASEFDKPSGKAAAFRKRVFELAAPMHPIVEQREGIFEHDLASARQRLCAEFKLTWEEIESRLFSDVIELQKLILFPGDLAPATLLARYNVAQTQAALYRATLVRIDAFAQAPTIIRHAKLAGLMHRVSRYRKPGGGDEFGYRMILDGPASNLRETSRYGIGFAKLIPTLLTCSDWHLMAKVLGPRNQHFTLALSPADQLSSEATPPAEFDSKLEERLAELWSKSPVNGWRLMRDEEFLIRQQEVFTPDFVLTRDDGVKIYIEVVGFWTPEYLQEKRRRLGEFMRSTDRPVHWLLMFDKVAAASKTESMQDLGIPAVILSKKSDPQEWIQAAMGVI